MPKAAKCRLQRSPSTRNVMKITSENYEQWALDYLEGTLPSEQRSAFERFLQTHAREAAEIKSLQEFMPIVPADPIVFPEAALLRRRPQVTPLRRFLSLVSGAAAAAVIAGGFLWIDHTSSRPKVAMSSVVVSDSTSTAVSDWRAEAVIAQATGEGAEKASGVPAVSVSEGTVESVVRPLSSGASRVARWNQKTAALLERMEARNERRQLQAEQEAQTHAGLTEQPIDAVVVAEAKPQGVSSPLSSPSEGASLSEAGETNEAILRLETPETMTLAYEEPMSAGGDPSFEWPVDRALPAMDESLLSDNARMLDSLDMQELRTHRERGLLRALFSPLERISPIKYYETEEGRGVEIASILRIGSRNR